MDENKNSDDSYHSCHHCFYFHFILYQERNKTKKLKKVRNIELNIFAMIMFEFECQEKKNSWNITNKLLRLTI